MALKTISGLGVAPWLTETFDKTCRDMNLAPWQVGTMSVCGFVTLKFLVDQVSQEETLFTRLKLFVFAAAKKIPFVRNKIDAQVAEVQASFQKSLVKVPNKYTVNYSLPEKGLNATELEAELIKLRDLADPEKRLREGKVTGTIYVGGEGHQAYTEMLTKVYGMFAWTNPLHATVFPGVREMEAEVVQMTVDLFHGGCAEDACGLMTSGGTESIIMALKAYRDYGRVVRGITNPNIVMPRTAHPAFNKGCHFLGINLRIVDENKDSWRANVRAMERRIDRNTLCIVGSCPQYPHGVVDPIEDLSNLALKYKVGLHVDCCLGSFLNPFMREAGFDFPKFDFELPGVTTISCDTHKYGFAPKGTSVVMYRSRALRKHTYYVFTTWPGGNYGTPSMAGSRSGALIATTYAALLSHGREGFVKNVKKIINATRAMAKGLEKIPGLKLMAQPESSVLCWGSDVFDINRLGPLLGDKKGWDLNILQFPPSIHISVTMAHAKDEVVKQFLEDLAECTAEIMKNPNEKATGAAAMYGTSQSIPDRSIIEEIVDVFIDCQLAVPSKAE
eukprot:m.19185 g.19185  ORF g.19185 m.19185 type:complete len:559 (-) comp6507_c0_seq1:2944-4620(-)